MNIVKYAPQTHADRFFDTDRFFNDFWPWASFENSKAVTDQVKVNVVENKDNYILTAEVPGLTEKDIDIEIKDGLITLKGHTEESQEKEEDHYRMKEFSHRNFERSFRIGEGIDPDKVSAQLNHGVLTMVLPRREEAKPKTVKVGISS
jgi:HSP20 family protein